MCVGGCVNVSSRGPGATSTKGILRVVSSQNGHQNKTGNAPIAGAPRRPEPQANAHATLTLLSKFVCLCFFFCSFCYFLLYFLLLLLVHVIMTSWRRGGFGGGVGGAHPLSCVPSVARSHLGLSRVAYVCYFFYLFFRVPPLHVRPFVCSSVCLCVCLCVRPSVCLSGDGSTGHLCICDTRVITSSLPH